MNLQTANQILVISQNKELRDNWNDLIKRNVEKWLGVYFLNKKGEILGKFDTKKYESLNEFQILLHEYSEPYRMTFIKPFECKI